MKFPISVIICTHNPKSSYLERVLGALNQQTLDFSLWELLLVDNASTQRLSSEIDLNWHPHARHVREEELGLTPARLRGIREAQADILVFVDDDNVLAKDYLEITGKIGEDYPFIGAWGGQIHPEFEVDPPEWTKPYWGMLAIREFERDSWSNLLHQHITTPCGAGICVRYKVAQRYSNLVNTDKRRITLDRIGESLSSCGDSDLAYTACDLGMGTGQFSALKVTHLIPKARLEKSYLEKLAEEISYSTTILESFRGNFRKGESKVTWRTKLFKQYQLLRMHPCQRSIVIAFQRGNRRATYKLASIQK
jgi:glycosyltransferase involved in cell wall biosynthesis